MKLFDIFGRNKYTINKYADGCINYNKKFAYMMVEMRNRSVSILLILVIFCATLPIIPFLMTPVVNSNSNHDEISNLRTSASIELNDTLIINDLPGNPANWTWAKDQGYCTGSGTLLDPYVIADIFFNTSTIFDNCLSIRNSRKHFRIRDCEFKGDTQYAGIQLFNTTLGVVYENSMYPNTGALVWVSNSSYNVIRNNNASA